MVCKQHTFVQLAQVSHLKLVFCVITCLTKPLSRAVPAAELQEKVTQLELTLAAAQRRVSEVQQVADAAQQQNDASQRLREEIEQLRTASHHKDIELDLVKVLRRVSLRL